MKYAFEFSPDGQHFTRQGIYSLAIAWSFLTGVESYFFKKNFPKGKIRIVNLKTKAIVGDKV